MRRAQSKPGRRRPSRRNSLCGPAWRLASQRGRAEFTRAVSASHDFVSLEIIPAFAGSAEWQIIQRFRSPEALTRWVEDEARATLLASLTALESDGKGPHADEAAPDYHSTTTVTEVITTVVKPGQEEAFRRWAERIQQGQARFPGYMGTLVQAPLSPEVPYWTTLVRFESPAFLDAWLQSPERQAILAEATPQVSTWRSHRMSNPFAGWFANEQRLAPPPAWKQTCLVLLVLFPVVMLEIRFLSPLLNGLPLTVSTFIGNAISVLARVMAADGGGDFRPGLVAETGCAQALAQGVAGRDDSGRTLRARNVLLLPPVLIIRHRSSQHKLITQPRKTGNGSRPH